MRCEQHGKAVQGHCQWCGKLLCKQCVAKSHNGKLFCDKCGEDLAPTLRTIQLKQIREEAATQDRRATVERILRREF